MNRPRRPALLWVLAILLAAEFLLVATLAVLSIVSVVQGGSQDVASGVAVAILIVLAAIWLGAMVVGTLRGRSWIRAAALVWQVLQISIGVAALLGTLGQPLVGWPLVIVGVAAFVLLFTPPVVAATRRRDDRAV